MLFLQQIRKELFREKTRVILTILAIAWGTFAIAIMLAIGTGLRTTFTETFAAAGHNLLTIKGGRTTKLYHGQHVGVKIYLTPDDFTAISRLPNIAAISPQYSVSDSLYYKTQTANQAVLAVAENYAQIHSINIKAGGRFISPLDVQKSNFVIVLGEEAAKNLFPHNKNPVGKTVQVNNHPFLIIGVMQHKPEIVATPTSDAFNNWIPVTTGKLLINSQIMDGIDLTYKDPHLLPELEQQILQAVALQHHFDPSDDNLVHFTEFAKRQQQTSAFLLGLQIFLGIVGALTLLVAGVGIANVMYASVNRGTREIGLRMALGAKTYQILWHYLAEALLATAIGGVLGLGVAALVVHGLQKLPLSPKLISVIGHPRPVLSIAVIAIVIIILGIIGFLAALFPALKATQVDPTEALAYE